MKVGIVQVDGNGFPNLALMQITHYYERIGDTVEWYKGRLFDHEYGAVYASKIFKFSQLPDLPPHAIIGGTGVDDTKTLPTEMVNEPLSYSLYPDCNYHIGFTQKGCRLKCSFCVVPKKEGAPRFNSTIDDLIKNPNGANRLMLLDNDFFALPDWKANLTRIKELNLKVCFVQGLNIRKITEEQAACLAHIKYTNSKFNQKYLTFAWDNYKDKKLVLNGIDICEKAGIPASKMQFFVLIGFATTPEQDMERVMMLRDLGAMPFVMPYNKKDPYQKAFARWVNHRATFKSCTWEEYKYRINTTSPSPTPPHTSAATSESATGHLLKNSASG